MLRAKQLTAIILATAVLLSVGLSGMAAPAAVAEAPGTTYYISASGGNDANNGTSPSTPWQSIDKVNATTFQPGDQILFKARDEWHGQIWFKGMGTEENPIKVDMYGNVQVGDEVNYPAIHGDGELRKQGSTGTVMMVNTAYWEVRHLQITNDDNWEIDNYNNQYDPVTRLCTNMRDGIMVLLNADELPAGTDDFVLRHVYIEENYIHNVDSVGFWTNGRGAFSPDLNTNNALFSGGIMAFIVGSAKPNMTFDGLRIANNTLKTVDFLGIGTFDFSDHNYMQENTVTLNHMMKNVYIGYNYCYDIGQGVIDACNMDGGIVEYNVGDKWGQRYNAECAGIYPWRSNNTVLSHNIVSNGPTSFPATTGDGTAWDVDSGLYRITYEHNYSYNNRMGTTSYLGRNWYTTYRYNIADRDQGYFIKWGWFDRDFTDVYFTNNVCYFDSTADTVPGTSENASPVYRFSGANTAIANYFRIVKYYFLNNLFYDYGTASTHHFWQGRTANTDANYGTAVFQNNYFYEANNPGVYAANVRAPWQNNTALNTGNFYHNWDGNGVLAEPKLVGVTPTFAAAPPLNKPMDLSDPFWSNFKLQADSPLIDKGKFVPQMGQSDFYGNDLYYGAAPDIGVHEFTEGKTKATGLDYTITGYGRAKNNLALFKPVTTQYSNASAYALTDGCYEDSENGSIPIYWTSSNAKSQYIDIDFGAQTTFNNINLFEMVTTAATSGTGSYYPRRPHIQYYNYQYWDGAKWVTFYDATPDVDRAAGANDAVEGTPVTTTYLKDVFAGVTTNKLRINLLAMDDVAVLREIEVCNLDAPELTKPAQANLSIGATSSTAAAELFDDNQNTTYTGLAGTNTIDIALAAPVKFNKISLGERSGHLTAYTLQAQIDGTYVPLITRTGAGTINTNLFSAVTAQNLRLIYTAAQPPVFSGFDVYRVDSFYTEPDVDTSGSLVGNYNFDSVTVDTILDSSGRNNHAKIYNVQMKQDSDRGRVAYFGHQGYSNADYLMVPAGLSDFRFTTGYTISMWIKPDPVFMYAWAPTNGAVTSALYSKGYNGLESYSTTMRYNGLTGAFQSPHVMMADNGTSQGPRWYPTSAGSQENNYYVRTGEWNHVVFTWDGYYYNAYVNGLRVLHTRVKNPYVDAPRSLFNNATLNNQALYFGNQKASSSGAVTRGQFFGYMDDISVYNNALSYKQIRALDSLDEIKRISVTPPTKTTFNKGETLDLTGMVVTATLADGTTRELAVNEYSVEPAANSVLNTAGTITVVVTVAGTDTTFKADFDVTVKERFITSLKTGTAAVISLKRGQTLQLKPVWTPSDLSPVIEYTSSNTTVATVGLNTGLINATKAGMTLITLKAQDGSGLTAQVAVTVVS